VSTIGKKNILWLILESNTIKSVMDKSPNKYRKLYAKIERKVKRMILDDQGRKATRKSPPMKRVKSPPVRSAGAGTDGTTRRLI
jgi:hypothetical protein